MLLQRLAVVTLDVLDDGNTSLSNVRKSIAPITGSKLALKPAADALAATTAQRLLGKGENTWSHMLFVTQSCHKAGLSGIKWDLAEKRVISEG